VWNELFFFSSIYLYILYLIYICLIYLCVCVCSFDNLTLLQISFISVFVFI
jgi:hypothetical protein